MKDVELKILPIKAIWIVLSAILILNGVIWFVTHLERLNFVNISYPLFVIAAGIYFLSRKSEIDKVSLRSGDLALRINWHGWIKAQEIAYSDIKKIYLRKNETVIIRDGMKDLKLRLDNMKVSQKSEVYNFFIELSEKAGLALERQFD